MAFMCKESINVKLTYKGPTVDAGTISIDDLISALAGFSSAYNKLASYEDHRKLNYSSHNIQVVALSQGSFESCLQVIVEYATPIAALVAAIVPPQMGYEIITKLIEVININLHVKNGPTKIDISGNYNVFIMNEAGANLNVSRPAYNYFKDHIIDADILKIVDPLQEGSINEVSLTATSSKGKEISKTISYLEKPYIKKQILDIPERWVYQEIEIVGKMNSLIKSRRKGTFIRKNGSHVPYSFSDSCAVEVIESFAFDGLVIAKGIGKINSSYMLESIEIKEVVEYSPLLFNDTAKGKK